MWALRLLWDFLLSRVNRGVKSINRGVKRVVTSFISNSQTLASEETIIAQLAMTCLQCFVFHCAIYPTICLSYRK